MIDSTRMIQSNSLSSRLRGTSPACWRVHAQVCPTRRLHKHNAFALPADFIPTQANDVFEPAAREMAARMRRVPVAIPTLPRSPEVATAFVGPTKEEESRYPKDAPTIVLLHGFDSSCMEFRRLHPLLAAAAPTYAVDVVRHAQGHSFSLQQ